MTYECSHVRQGAVLDSTMTLILVPHHAHSIPSHVAPDGEPYVRMILVCDQCALKPVNMIMDLIE